MSNIIENIRTCSVQVRSPEKTGTVVIPPTGDSFGAIIPSYEGMELSEMRDCQQYAKERLAEIKRKRTPAKKKMTLTQDKGKYVLQRE
jgi:hypothetical protein